MSAAIVPSKGRSRQLDGRSEPDEVVTPEDATDTVKLARLLIRVLRELATLRRRWWPRRIDFEDVDTGSAATLRLAHGLGGRVRWWIVEQDDGFGVLVGRNTASDDNTLVLTSSGSGVVTIRVEEAG